MKESAQDRDQQWWSVRRPILWAVIGILLALYFSTPVSADGGAPNLAYVSGTPQGISVINIAQQKVTDTLAVAGNPQTVLLSTDGRLLYVTQPARGRVAVLATKSKQEVCSAPLPGSPTLLTLDPGSNTLYAASTSANVVTALNPMSCAVVHTLHTRSAVNGLGVAIVGSGLAGGNGNQIWVAENDGILLFDGNGRQLASIPLAQPRYLSIPPAPNITAYVTTKKGELVAVDLNSHRVSSPLLRGGDFGPMDFDETNDQVYVPDRAHGTLNVINPVQVGNGENTVAPHQPRRTYTFDANPQAVAITSDGQLGFVALANGSVTMLDLPGQQVLNRFKVGGSPQFIITGLYPSFISLTPQQSILAGILDNVVHYGAAGVVVLAAVFAVLYQKRREKRQMRIL